MREPASFLRSLHLQFVQSYVETEGDLRKALSLEDERRRGRRIPRHTYWPQALLYSEHVRYVEQLRRYHAEFPPENVLVLIYDDFRADNEGTVRAVLRFLEVDDTVQIERATGKPDRARPLAAPARARPCALGRNGAGLAGDQGDASRLSLHRDCAAGRCMRLSAAWCSPTPARRTRS